MGRSLGGLDIDLVDMPKELPVWEYREITVQFTATGTLTPAEQDICRQRIAGFGDDDYQRREAAQEATFRQVMSPGTQLWRRWLARELAETEDPEIASRLAEVLAQVQTLPESTKEETVPLFSPERRLDFTWQFEKADGGKWVGIFPLPDEPIERGVYLASEFQFLKWSEKVSVMAPIHVNLAPGHYRIRVQYAYTRDADPWFAVFRGRLTSDWHEFRVVAPPLPAQLQEIAEAIPAGWFMVYRMDCENPAGWRRTPGDVSSGQTEVFCLASEAGWVYEKRSQLDLEKACWLERTDLTYRGQPGDEPGYTPAQFLWCSGQSQWYGKAESKEVWQVVSRIRELLNESE